MIMSTLCSWILAGWFVGSERDDNLFSALMDFLQLVSIVIVVCCCILLHPIWGIFIGVFLVCINFQVLGVMALMGMSLDLLPFGVFVMAIGFEIEYVLHIAHAFVHCKGYGLKRTRFALENMGMIVFSAFLSTATQQVILLVAASSNVFRIYALTLILIIVKSGVSGFIFVPSILGIIHAGFLAMGGRQPAPSKPKLVQDIPLGG